MANPHFQQAESWEAAKALVPFQPRVPRRTAGHRLGSLAVFVRDYKGREVSMGERTLEAHYGAFMVSQSRPGRAAARRQALEVSYGAAPVAGRVRGNEARLYERGPEPEAGDPDPRMPAVVVWCEGEMLFLVASGDLEVAALLPIAASME